MTDLTREYIKQIINTDYSDIKKRTLEEARLAILDAVGCIIGGTQSPIGKSAIQVLGGLGGLEEATVIGTGKKMPAPLAAYITGQCCVGPDLSDNYMESSYIISHPGEAVMPAILALGEKTGANLEDVIMAMIIGYETAARYANAIEPRREEVYSFSTHYTLAAAMACAKMLHYNEDKSINVLGIAGTLAPLPVTGLMWGFRERPASWHRDMPGHSNFAAVMSCLFAETDFTATRHLLEEKTKYYKIAGSDHYNPEWLFKSWGENYAIEKVTYKSIPSCYFNQPCIQAVIDLIAENDINKEDLIKIELHAPSKLAKNFNYYPPKTSVDTASSVKYLTAMTLFLKEPGPEWYLDFEKYMSMENYKKFSSKIQVFEDDQLQAVFDQEGKLLGKAVIQTNKKTYQKTVQWVKGSHVDPFTQQELIDKFLSLASPVVGNKKAENFAHQILHAEPKVSIKEIIDAL